MVGASAKTITSLDTAGRFFRFLFLAALFTSFLGPYLALPGYKEISAYRVLHLMAIPFAYLAVMKLGPFSKEARWVSGLIGLFFLYAVLSVLWAVDPFRGLQYAAFLTSGIFLLFTPMVLGSKKIVIALIVVLLGFAFLNVLLAPVEIIFDKHLPFSRANEDIRVANMPTGFFHNPNDLGTAISLLIPFALFLPIWRREKYISLIVIGLALVLTVLVFLTGSRGASGAAVLVWMVSGVIYRNRIAAFSPALSFFAVTIVVPMIILLASSGQLREAFFAFVPDRIEEKVTQITDRQPTQKLDASTSFRGLILEASLKSLGSHPLGAGAGGAENYLSRNLPFENETNPHNLWAEVGINYGMTGLGLWMAFYFGLLILLIRTYRKSEDTWLRYLAVATLTMELALIPGSISPSTMWRGFPLLWITMGVGLFCIAQQASGRNGAAVET